MPVWVQPCCLKRLAVILPQLIPEEVRIHVPVALGIDLFPELVGQVEEIGAFMLAVEAVELGQVVNPLGQLGEAGVLETIFPALLDVLQVAVGNAAVVFLEYLHGLGE